MYINELHYINVGPINRADVTLMQDSDTIPHPVVFVGKNGSGKSIILSNIVDMFYEMAQLKYGNAVHYRHEGGYYYYKIIASQLITLGKSEMFAHIKFQQEKEHYEYIYKSSSVSKEEYTTKYGIPVDNNFHWDNKIDAKGISIPKDSVQNVFEKEIVCFFGPSRFIDPIWLGDQYSEKKREDTYSSRTYFEGQLKNQIEPQNEEYLLRQWLFDVITDAKPEVSKSLNGKYNISFPNPRVMDLLMIAKENIEKIISAILCEKVKIRMQNRSAGEGRLAIIRESDSGLIVPSLASLSTGQMALLNLFGTILRYADVDNIDNSHRLHEIRGVVVIDEIELHLHAQLQREVLPKLIKLFPLVQFIITSHSPLFLLGMQEEFGDDGFDIYEMPSATKISTEYFSEFENAYKYFSETKRYHEEIRKALNSKNEKPIIITEGATDWRHMKAAVENLKRDPEFDWLSQDIFEFLEYDPKNGAMDNVIKLEMGWTELIHICESFSKIHQQRKIIVIADNDVQKACEKLAGEPYKNWGNNVYSLCLPIPESRSETPQISIEHYYSDEEIKREVTINGINRRLFMGNEFEKHGIGKEIGKYCDKRESCGSMRIDIIDGSGNAKVMDLETMDESMNFALSKMQFAKMVLQETYPFNNMDFSNFKTLLSIIKEIIDLPME